MQPLDARQPPDLHVLTGQVKALARGLGFDLVGIAPAAASARGAFFREWLSDGKAGEMTFLADRIDERLDPAQFLPNARTVVCVAMNYFHPLNDEPKPGACKPGDSAPDEFSFAQGKIARYALGDDYHELIKNKLYAIADFLKDAVPGSYTRCGVDTAPINERELASRTGVGWVGKNTCVINERIGSWLFLGSVLTTIDLPIDSPAVDRCGTCTRCIEACPTAAITPYQLDARKCISYLTIEHPIEIDPTVQLKMGDWLFGCDICQDVCPWNSKAPATEIPELQPRIASGRLVLQDVLNWHKEDFDRTFRRSAVKRIRLPQLHRNARIAVENGRGGLRESAGPSHND